MRTEIHSNWHTDIPGHVCVCVSVCISVWRICVYAAFCVLFWCRVMVIHMEADYTQHLQDEKELVPENRSSAVPFRIFIENIYQTK